MPWGVMRLICNPDVRPMITSALGNSHSSHQELPNRRRSTDRLAQSLGSLDCRCGILFPDDILERCLREVSGQHCSRCSKPFFVGFEIRMPCFFSERFQLLNGASVS